MARYGYSRKYSRNTDKFIDGLFKVGASMASAYAKEAKRQQREQARRQAAYSRLLEQQEREEIRQIKQHEMAMRRAERERERAEREREKAAKLQARLDEQKRVEDEIAEIEDNNSIWNNVHGFIGQIVTIDDVNDVIAKCDNEQQNDIKDGYFKTVYPTDVEAKRIAKLEADKIYLTNAAEKELSEARMNANNLKFDEAEPTIESVRLELESEAKEVIKAFLPWKQSRLRQKYVDDSLSERFDESHKAWWARKHDYISKKKELSDVVEVKKKILDDINQKKSLFIQNRTKELYDKEIKTWEEERDVFYDSLRQSMQNLVDGDRNYVIAAISSLFPDDELPMEYFVDFVYEEEKGKVLVDLDLPEIEDLPDKKIILTPTGKKSIRLKGQTDLRSDYANCVFGLAMYVAYSIFNISLKVQEIEISGFTQRKESNSAVAIDQYVFVVSFTRELFSEIDFNRLSSLQIMDFFHRHFNMTKGFDMKQIDLSTAFDKMESFVPANYNVFIASLPPQPSQLQKPSLTNRIPSNATVNTPNATIAEDAPIDTFEKASLFIDEVYKFIDRMTKDPAVSKHADYLNGVKITWTTGNFSGDADTNTYRGRLFFCLTVDMFRSLKKMLININDLNPDSYAFALLVDRIYMHFNVKYTTLNTIKSPYIAFCDMLNNMYTKMPIFDHYFMLGEVLCDYERDLSWYKQYLELMFKHTEIIRKTIHNNARKLKNVDDFSKFIMSFLSSNSADAINQNDVDMQHLDPMFEDAARLIVREQSGSTALIQRKFVIGYNRAGRLMDQLEKAGIVGATHGSKPREVLITDENSLENLLAVWR